MGWSVVIIGSMVLCTAARCRMSTKHYRYNGEGAISTPFAEALGQVVGMAGGIYLSLMLLCDFLAVELPKKVFICGNYMDFLALIALILACVQPIVLWMVRRER